MLMEKHFENFELDCKMIGKWILRKIWCRLVSACLNQGPLVNMIINHRIYKSGIFCEWLNNYERFEEDCTMGTVNNDNT
jgi:hypothetical protein